MQNITPNLAVKNVKESINFYKDVLEFTLEMAVPKDKSGFGSELDKDKDYIWAMMKNGGAEVMFQESASFKEDIGDIFDSIGASISFYIRVDDVNSLHDKLLSKVEIVKDIETTWYGMREFYIKDCNGYILGFGTQETQ